MRTGSRQDNLFLKYNEQCLLPPTRKEIISCMNYFSPSEMFWLAPYTQAWAWAMVWKDIGRENLESELNFRHKKGYFVWHSPWLATSKPRVPPLLQPSRTSNKSTTKPPDHLLGVVFWKRPRWSHQHRHETHAATQVPNFKKPILDLILCLGHLKLLPMGSLFSSLPNQSRFRRICILYGCPWVNGTDKEKDPEGQTHQV